MRTIDDSICVVVPVYNAADTLRDLTTQLAETLDTFSSWQIVLVNDQSTDNSADIIRDLCHSDNRITGIVLDVNAGQQCAVFCGIRFSTANYTVIIDDDLEQSPKDILALYDEIIKGYDVVYGVSNAVSQKGLFRHFGSALRDRLFDAVTGKPKDKKVCSFRIMNRATIENVLRADTRFVYISMEILRHTHNIQNIPVAYNASAPSGFSLLRLMALLLKIYIYYAPRRVLKRLRKKGVCYKIKNIIRNGQ